MLIFILMLILVIVLDQGSKYILLEMLDGYNYEINNHLNIVSVWNKGISFGLFRDFEYANYIFLSLSATIIMILLFLLRKDMKHWYISVPIAMIIGGAVGNMIDRIMYGAVYDFIDVHGHGVHWPAFNIADSFVCLGVIGFVYVDYRQKSQK